MFDPPTRMESSNFGYSGGRFLPAIDNIVIEDMSNESSSSISSAEDKKVQKKKNVVARQAPMVSQSSQNIILDRLGAHLRSQVNR